METKQIRTNLLPALLLSFVIVAATGVMLLLHLELQGIKHLHQWMSLLFVLVCGVHLLLNWKVVQVLLPRGPVLVSVIGIGLFSLLLVLSGGGHDGHGHYGRPGGGQFGSRNNHR